MYKTFENNGINYLSTGAEFQPSTVSWLGVDFGRGVFCLCFSFSFTVEKKWLQVKIRCTDQTPVIQTNADLMIKTYFPDSLSTAYMIWFFTAGVLQPQGTHPFVHHKSGVFKDIRWYKLLPAAAQ